MSSLDLLTLSAAIRSPRGYASLLQAGFEPGLLSTGTGCTIHQFLMEYYENPVTRGSTPSLEMTKAYFPEIDLPDPGSQALTDLVHALREGEIVRSARALAADFQKQLVDQYNPNVIPILGDLRDRLEALLTKGHASSDSCAQEGLSAAVESYERGLSGEQVFIPWPWPELARNRWTLGMEDTDYTIIYGRPKNKKSFLLLFFVVYLFLQGYPILIYSKEMPAEQIWRRVLGFMANLPYSDLTTFTLGDEDYLRMYETVAQVRDLIEQGKGNMHCVSGKDAPGKMDSVSWLLGKIRNYRPAVVVVDGIYLMANPQKTRSDTERVMGVSQALRNMNLHEKLPIIGTVQANRKLGNKAALDDDDGDGDDVAFSDGLMRDATAMLRIVASRTDPTATILWRAGREMFVPNFKINAKPCTDFSFLEVVQREQAQSIMEEDDAEGEAAPPSMPSMRPKKGRKASSRPADPLDDAVSSDIRGLMEQNKA